MYVAGSVYTRGRLLTSPWSVLLTFVHSLLTTIIGCARTRSCPTRISTGTEHAFSVVKWGMKTAAFVRAAKKKGPEATHLMASMAYKHLKKPGGEKYASIDSEDEMDDREDVW